MRTLFLGDLEAQYKICRNELEMQVGPTLDEVIQLGNLISVARAAKDKKESGRNETVLAFWDKFNVTKKTRLMGDNEMAALNFPTEWTNNASNTFLREGWLTETPTIFTATHHMGRLVTHGGLTWGEWVAIDRPPTAEKAAEALNAKYAQTLYQGSCWKIDSRPNGAANPIWADPILETYASWVLTEEHCPFDQIHGGESLNTVRGRAAASYETSQLFYIDGVSYRKFGSLAIINEAVFRGIDLSLTPRTLPSLPKDKAFYIEIT